MRRPSVGKYRSVKFYLKTMSSASQCYFGDWVNCHGYGDVGYYLDGRFAGCMLSIYDFDEFVLFDIFNWV